MFWNKLKYGFVTTKIYMQRSNGYIAILNSMMLIFLTLSDLKKYGLNFDLGRWIIPLLLLCVFASILFGYIEDKTGIWKAEAKVVTKRNPQITQILEEIKEIRKSL